MPEFVLNRRHLLAGAALSLALPLASKVSAADAKVLLGVIRLPSQAPSFIAYERGYFKDEGLEAELKYFEAAQPLAVAVASNNIDFGLTSITGGLVALAAQDKVRVIGGALMEEKGVVGHIILASNAAYDNGLTSPEKLPGHTIGITTTGSSFDFMAYKVAQKCGFAMADIKLRPLQKVGALAGAIASNQIDCWMTQPGIARKIVAAGQAKQIGLVSDYAPNYQVTTLFTSMQNVNDRPRTEAFIRAYARAVEDFNKAFIDKTSNADEVDALSKIIHQYIDRELPFTEAKDNLINAAMRINPGLSLLKQSCDEQLQWIMDSKMIDGQVPLDRLVDPSFVKTI